MDPPQMEAFKIPTSIPGIKFALPKSSHVTNTENEHNVTVMDSVPVDTQARDAIDVTQQPDVSQNPQSPKYKAKAERYNVKELDMQAIHAAQAPQKHPDNLKKSTESEGAVGVAQPYRNKIERRNTRGAKPLPLLPPKSLIVEPLDGLKSPDAITPSIDKSTNPNFRRREAPSSDKNKDVPQKPTCSLNIICYSRGCSLGQVSVALRGKFESDSAFTDALAKTPRLITDDEQLFERLRDEYFRRMCGFWRRNFSLKTLRRLRLLCYTENARPTHVPMDELTMQEVLYAFNHPSQAGHGTDWIEWIFRLRQPDKRHALEFVEGWNGTRIAIVGLLPCLASTLVGVIWSARGGDVQTAFTVAGFILTVTTVLIALLAVVSSIDSKAY